MRGFCRAILSCIHYLHTPDEAASKPSIIHRDIKCDNIFKSGQSIKIGDLGLATEAAPNVAKTVLGTPEFMAPEMYAEGGEYTATVDIHAFAMSVLEMILGHAPYSECKSFGQMFRRITNGEPPDALEHLSWIWPEAAEFVRQAIGVAEEVPAPAPARKGSSSGGGDEPSGRDGGVGAGSEGDADDDRDDDYLSDQDSATRPEVKKRYRWNRPSAADLLSHSFVAEPAEAAALSSDSPSAAAASAATPAILKGGVDTPAAAAPAGVAAGAAAAGAEGAAAAAAASAAAGTEAAGAGAGAGAGGAAEGDADGGGAAQGLSGPVASGGTGEAQAADAAGDEAIWDVAISTDEMMEALAAAQAAVAAFMEERAAAALEDGGTGAGLDEEGSGTGADADGGFDEEELTPEEQEELRLQRLAVGRAAAEEVLKRAVEDHKAQLSRSARSPSGVEEAGAASHADGDHTQLSPATSTHRAMEGPTKPEPGGTSDQPDSPTSHSSAGAAAGSTDKAPIPSPDVGPAVAVRRPQPVPSPDVGPADDDAAAPAGGAPPSIGRSTSPSKLAPAPGGAAVHAPEHGRHDSMTDLPEPADVGEPPAAGESVPSMGEMTTTAGSGTFAGMDSHLGGVDNHAVDQMIHPSPAYSAESAPPAVPAIGSAATHSSTLADGVGTSDSAQWSRGGAGHGAASGTHHAGAMESLQSSRPGHKYSGSAPADASAESENIGVAGFGSVSSPGGPSRPEPGEATPHAAPPPLAGQAGTGAAEVRASRASTPTSDDAGAGAHPGQGGHAIAGGSSSDHGRGSSAGVASPDLQPTPKFGHLQSPHVHRNIGPDVGPPVSPIPQAASPVGSTPGGQPSRHDAGHSASGDDHQAAGRAPAASLGSDGGREMAALLRTVLQRLDHMQAQLSAQQATLDSLQHGMNDLKATSCETRRVVTEQAARATGQPADSARRAALTQAPGPQPQGHVPGGAAPTPGPAERPVPAQGCPGGTGLEPPGEAGAWQTASVEPAARSSPEPAPVSPAGGPGAADGASGMQGRKRSGSRAAASGGLRIGPMLTPAPPSSRPALPHLVMDSSPPASGAGSGGGDLGEDGSSEALGQAERATRGSSSGAASVGGDVSPMTEAAQGSGIVQTQRHRLSEELLDGALEAHNEQRKVAENEVVDELVRSILVQGILPSQPTDGLPTLPQAMSETVDLKRGAFMRNVESTLKLEQKRLKVLAADFATMVAAFADRRSRARIKFERSRRQVELDRQRRRKGAGALQDSPDDPAGGKVTPSARGEDRQKVLARALDRLKLQEADAETDFRNELQRSNEEELAKIQRNIVRRAAIIREIGSRLAGPRSTLVDELLAVRREYREPIASKLPEAAAAEHRETDERETRDRARSVLHKTSERNEEQAWELLREFEADVRRTRELEAASRQASGQPTPGGPPALPSMTPMAGSSLPMFASSDGTAVGLPPGGASSHAFHSARTMSGHDSREAAFRRPRGADHSRFASAASALSSALDTAPAPALERKASWTSQGSMAHAAAASGTAAAAATTTEADAGNGHGYSASPGAAAAGRSGFASGPGRRHGMRSSPPPAAGASAQLGIANRLAPGQRSMPAMGLTGDSRRAGGIGAAAVLRAPQSVRAGAATGGQPAEAAAAPGTTTASGASLDAISAADGEVAAFAQFAAVTAGSAAPASGSASGSKAAGPAGSSSAAK